MWKDGNLIIYSTRVKERGKDAVVGYVELRDIAKL
jgi:hypothetical protein